MEALLWTVDRIFANEASNRRATDGTAVSGLAASPGRYTGAAVVATANATVALRDGQLVTVDGSTGQVEAHD